MKIAATHPIDPEEIMALLDGELSPTEAAAVTAHLDGCPNCAALAQDLRGVSHTLHEWRIESVPATLTSAIDNSIRSLPVPSRISRLRRLFGWKSWTAIGVCTAAVLIMFVGLEKQESHQLQQSYAMLSEQNSAPPTKLRELTSLQPPLPLASTARASKSEYYYDAPRTDVAPKGIIAVDTLAPASTSPQQIAAPMISRTVSLDVVVPSVEKTRTSIDAILARHQGYAADLNETEATGARALVASLRIPASQLDAAVAEFKTLGHVSKEEQKGEDVSPQHEDLVARLKNARETEERFRDILEHHTGKIEDILEVEQEIARVRGEIEGMEAEQQALEHRVSYATVELLVADQSQAAVESPLARLRHAIVNGWQNAVSTVLGIILFFAEDGPAIFVWVAILSVPGYLLWRRYKRIRAKQ